MRFCPFCAQELQDDASHCVYCGKRLPTRAPLPAPSAAPPDLPSSSPVQQAKTPPKRTVFGYAAPTVPSSPTKDKQPNELLDGEQELPADTQPEIPAEMPADTQPKSLPDAQPQEDTAPSLQDLLPPPPLVSGPGTQLDPVPPAPVPPTAVPPPAGPPATVPPATVPPATVPPPPVPAVPDTVQTDTAQPGTVLPNAVVPDAGLPDAVLPDTVQTDTVQPDMMVQPITVDPGLFAPVASVEESLDQTLTGPQFPGLDPMPVQGPLGFFGGLPYFFKVTKARFQRSGAIRTLKQEISQEQRKLDEILRDLGKKARDVELVHPPLQQEMEHLRSLEDKRSESEAGNVELTEQQSQAEQTFENVAKDCNQRMQAAQEEITSTQAQLTEKNGQLRALKSQLAQQQRQLQSLSSSLRSKTTQAAKAAQPDKQEALQQEAVEISAKMEQLEQQNTTAEAEIAQLQGPVDELTGALTDARQRLQQARQELAAGQQELNRTKGNLKLQQLQKGQEKAGLDREIAAKFLDIGKALESNRVEDPAFEELFGQINQVQDGIGKREQQAVDLEHQRESYDRAGMKNGMIIAGSIAGLVVILVVILIILVS